MTRLPDNLDQSLRIIAKGELVPIPLEDIHKLLAVSYITTKGKGWMVNSKGREYLKEHR